jgi:hypothetical protein
LNHGVISSLAVLAIFFFVFIAIYIDSLRLNLTAADTASVIEKAGIIGIFLTVLFYWIQQRDKKIEEMNEDKSLKLRACKTMLKELGDHKKAFSHPYDRINPDEKVNFIIAYFNSDAYHSLLYSGLFTHLEEDTQDDLANLYIRITNQNDDIKYRSRLRDSYLLHDKSPTKDYNWQNAVRKHEERITRWQDQIQKLTDTLEIRVRKEMEKYQ